MIIQHNLTSMNTSRQLEMNTARKASSAQKLSSGYAINKAADDAAGLSISEKMRSQIRGLDRASDNISDGISLTQVADGALAESHSILQRVNELAIQAANDTNEAIDREAIQQEVDQLVFELDRIATQTTFNKSIYPLSSDNADGKLIWPAGLEDTTVTVVNNTPYNVTFEGTTYLPGESISVDRVLGYLDGGQKKVLMQYEGGVNHIGGDYPVYELNNLTDSNITGDLKLTRYTMDDLGHKADNKVYVPIYNSVSDTYSDAFLFSVGFRWWDSKNALEVEKKEGSQYAIKIQSNCNTNQFINIPLVNASASALGMESLRMSSYTSCQDAIAKVQAAINKVSQHRSTFGSCQNALEHALKNIDNAAENTQAAESRIRDVDMSKEMVDFSKENILSQAMQAMLAQSNQSNEQVLRLLQ